MAKHTAITVGITKNWNEKIDKSIDYGTQMTTVSGNKANKWIATVPNRLM